MPKPKYKRILLKLSGEALCKEGHYGIDPEILGSVAEEIAHVANQGVQLAIVIGGGNIFRGVSGALQGIDRATADHMGMLATVMNSLALREKLESLNIISRVFSAIPMPTIAESYVISKARRQLEKRKVIILAAGTGNPFFTTDTAAALRAIETKADILLKATRVDGVYDQDPLQHPKAKKFETLSYQEVLEQGLKVMDLTAISLCKEHSLPILVFNMIQKGNIQKAVLGETVGTMIQGGEHAGSHS